MVDITQVSDPVNYSVFKGNTLKIWFKLTTEDADGNIIPLAIDNDAVLVYRVVNGSFTDRKSSADNPDEFEIIDRTTCEAKVHLSFEDTRNMPTGGNPYEIELQSGGEQTTEMWGTITIKEWANDD